MKREKTLCYRESESSISYKQSPLEFASQLSKYDVISFDVFDTLVFRPFSASEDRFILLEQKLHYPDFNRIRQESEKNVREEKYEREKHWEVTLDEIYEPILTGNGAYRRKAMDTELELEGTLCFGNPYMQIVSALLAKQGKRMIITTDTHLNSGQIRQILKKCGYPEFANIYVSCEKKASKRKGTLYEQILQNEGCNHTFAYVGDDTDEEAKQAKLHGFAVFGYENINEAGKPYRPYNMSALNGSIYRGIVNAHIHNGLMRYSWEYEYGYIYFGILFGFFFRTDREESCLYEQWKKMKDSLEDTGFDPERTDEVWSGIMDFVKHWQLVSENLGGLPEICEGDVYAPLQRLASRSRMEEL